MRLIDPKQAYEIARLNYSDFAMSLADLTSLREVLEDCDTIEVPRWIPVTERLPEETGKYIVCTSKGSVYCAKFYVCDTGCYDHGSYFGTDSNTKITHWMPLPDAPKDGE